MDHATFDTGQWLAYCGACPLPEMANAFRRCGIADPIRLRLPRGGRWPGRRSRTGCARPACAARCGTDGTGCSATSTRACSTSPPTSRSVPAQLGGHIEVLEIDDLRVRVEKVTDAETDDRVALARRRVRRRRLGGRGRPALGCPGLGRARPARRGLRPRQHGLLPPRPRRRDARAGRRRHDSRRLAADRARRARWSASTSSAPRSRC